MSTEMTEILALTSKAICRFLDETLPPLSPNDWWQKCVLAVLSTNQQRRLEQAKIHDLDQLDLAGLNKVLDQNWYRLDTLEGFTRDARHYVKELQVVRNRWAHASVSQQSDEDTYRDLDTIRRVLHLVGGSEELLARVRSERDQFLGTRTDTSRAGSTPQSDDHATFKPGAIVRLRSDSNVTGAITAVNPDPTEARYDVFLAGGVRTFYESQLELVAKDTPDGDVLSLDRFHAHLTALQLRHPNLSTLYSLNAARVDFIPYQYRPVLKFIRSDRPRLLIADGVGVGKTIEAGLILKELQARRDVRSVLIICPRPLVAEKKWLNEMRRFDERFTQLDGKTLRYCITETDNDSAWPDHHSKTIIPYSLFDETSLYGATGEDPRRKKRGQRGLLDLSPPPRFDLVIVDEAHHVRNPETFAHQAVRFFCDHADAAVFLTATPIQLASDDLFVLLNLLRPDLVFDRLSFAQMTEPNRHLNAAAATARVGRHGWEAEALEALNEALETPWGRKVLTNDPLTKALRTRLEAPPASPKERVAAISELESLHTLSRLINRTRRRDIGDFTVRDPQTVSIEFTPDQRRLHDYLLETQATILSLFHPGHTIKFLMTTIRRQAASCLFGLAPLIKDILERRLDQIGAEESDEDYGHADSESVATIRAKITQIITEAQRLSDSEDPKLDALVKVIEQKQKQRTNKLIVFSSFRHTLSYLHTHLTARDIRVGLVHGGVPDEERANLRSAFQKHAEDPEALDVLLFSEVGCEGLDYQFCDCIVNYDIPWNPMRIEQRIGRIDRRGQKSDKVLIYNFVTPGTVDADIFERCWARIEIFDRELGASEEILRRMSAQVQQIAADFQLTAEERQAKLQQVADNEIRLIQEQERLEDGQLELFQVTKAEDTTQQEIDSASSFWLSATAIENLVRIYLREISGGNQDPILGDNDPRTIRLSQAARGKLFADFQRLQRKPSPAAKQWEDWIRGADPLLRVTFSPDVAAADPGVTFITPLHPLVRQARNHLALEQQVPTVFAAAFDNEIPPGAHPFAMYEWRFAGIKDDLALVPIAAVSELEHRLPTLLELARTTELSEEQIPTPETFQQLEENHYQRWTAAREKHRTAAKQLATHRTESLRTSHTAHVAMLEERLAQADDEKIRRMRNSQLSTAREDFQRRLVELEESAERADIHAQVVAHGVMTVSRSDLDAN